MPCATVTEREKDGGVLPSLAAAAKALRRAARWSGRGPRAQPFPAHAGRSLSATAPPSESVAPRAGPASLGGTAVTGLPAGRLPTAGIGLSRVPVLVAASTASGPAPPCAAPHAPPSHSTHPPAGRTQQEPLGLRVGEGARGPRPAAQPVGSGPSAAHGIGSDPSATRSLSVCAVLLRLAGGPGRVTQAAATTRIPTETEAET